MTSCVERYDVIYQPFPINCQYLKTVGGEGQITISQNNVSPQYSAILTPGGRGEYSFIWPIRGCAGGKGMVFVLPVLNRVYSLAQVCPKHGI